MIGESVLWMVGGVTRLTELHVCAYSLTAGSWGLLEVWCFGWIWIASAPSFVIQVRCWLVGNAFAGYVDQQLRQVGVKVSYVTMEDYKRRYASWTPHVYFIQRVKRRNVVPKSSVLLRMSCIDIPTYTSFRGFTQTHYAILHWQKLHLLATWSNTCNLKSLN
jgi:hypothetical protein